MTGPLRDCRSREQVLDRWLHWMAVAAAPVAAFALLWNARHGRTQVLTGLIAYGIGLLAVIGCSALYHLCGASRRKPLFRRFDHAAIFLLIAGTYTPFALNGLLGSRGVVLLACVWALAMLGVTLKFLRPGMLERTSIALYLLLGWSVLAALDALMAASSSPSALALLAVGGILYTAGVVFHLWGSLPYQNAIWHGFVLAGAACHYAAIVHEIG
jgi:hemolysin III